MAEVLAGASKVLESARPIWCIELHGETNEAVIRILRKTEYCCFRVGRVEMFRPSCLPTVPATSLRSPTSGPPRWRSTEKGDHGNPDLRVCFRSEGRRRRDLCDVARRGPCDMIRGAAVTVTTPTLAYGFDLACSRFACSAGHPCGAFG